MLNQVQVTTQRPSFLTPVVPVAADLPIHEQPYSPALLLPLPNLSSAIVCDVDFAAACSHGYESYFEEMVNDDFNFEHRTYTAFEVYAFIHENVFTSEELDSQFRTTFPWRVGFIFGWLSALSKYQSAAARVGMQYVCAHIRVEERLHA